MSHIESVTFNKSSENHFPYNLSFFNNYVIDFSSSITIFVGDNGCGKSTFLELINQVLGLYRIKMDTPYDKEIMDLFKEVAKNIKIKYRLKKPQGFFFSAEDFTSYIHFLIKEKNYALNELKKIKTSNKSEVSKSFASLPYMRTVNEIDNLYSRDLLKSSHGESYLAFFQSRVHENEVYLLDEPETPLSMQNQLTLNYLIYEGVKRNCQFIIATHSPIIMALPNAKIYEITNDDIRSVEYDNIESVNLFKQFINYRESFMKRLFED